MGLVIPPAPAARVNDYAGVLAPGDRERVEQSIVDRERATGAQMAIAIFPSLEGESLEDVSIRLAEQWRIGQKSLDNGVILIVFIRDRQLRLEVGYGLEGVIPDSVAGAIIREAIAPRFREGRYAAGLEAAVAAVYGRVQGDPSAPAAPQPTIWPALVFAGLVILLIVLLGLEAYRTRGSGPGGGYTAGPGGWSGPILMPPRSRGGGGFRGGGFSGGGGRFGGGGASGRW